MEEKKSKNTVKAEKQVNNTQQQDNTNTEQAVEKSAPNCLRNEIIHVKFIKKFRGFVDNPQSPLYGGMADTAIKTYCVPLLRNGKLANPLTDDEMECLEKVMGFEPGRLSIYRQKDNYWKTSTRGCVNKVTITKDGMTLDLKNPEDYIKYKILLLNKEQICPSLSELESNPKPTHRFVMCSDNAESNSMADKVSMRRASNKMFEKYADNKSVLRTCLEIIEGKRLSPSSTIEQLQTKMLEFIDSKLKATYDVLSDNLIEYKALIKDGVEKGVIENRNGMYYLKDNGQKLCEEYDEPRFGTAAAYLANVKNQELYFSLQLKVK